MLLKQKWCTQFVVVRSTVVSHNTSTVANSKKKNTTLTTSYQEDEALPAHLLLIYHLRHTLVHVRRSVRALLSQFVDLLLTHVSFNQNWVNLVPKELLPVLICPSWVPTYCLRNVCQDITPKAVRPCCCCFPECCRSLLLLLWKVKLTKCAKWSSSSSSRVSQSVWCESVEDWKEGRRGWVELWKLSWTWNCWTGPLLLIQEFVAEHCGQEGRCALRCRLFCWHNEI